MFGQSVTHTDPRDNTDEWTVKLANSPVPPFLQEPLRCYFTERRNPGSFLMAVLTDRLSLAVTECADVVRAGDLVALVRWLQRHAPPHSWGNERVVEVWLTPAHHLGEGR